MNLKQARRALNFVGRSSVRAAGLMPYVNDPHLTTYTDREVRAAILERERRKTLRKARQ